MIPDTLMFRDKCQDDINFIHSTWIKSYRGREKGIRKLVYAVGQDAVIHRLLASADFVVLCSISDPDIIHGWACGQKTDDGNVLHYVYVPPLCWRQGWATSMVERVLGGYGDIIETSHIWPHVSERFVYNPYILRQ